VDSISTNSSGERRDIIYDQVIHTAHVYKTPGDTHFNETVMYETKAGLMNTTYEKNLHAN